MQRLIGLRYKSPATQNYHSQSRTHATYDVRHLTTTKVQGMHANMMLHRLLLLVALLTPCMSSLAAELCARGEFYATQYDDNVVLTALTPLTASYDVRLERRAEKIEPPAFDLVCASVRPKPDTPSAAAREIDDPTVEIRGKYLDRDILVFTAEIGIAHV